MRSLFSVLIISQLPTMAFADADTIQGVWEGTIGKNSIVACFNSDFPSGSYYYIKYLMPIKLYAVQDNPHSWNEYGETGNTGNTGKWELSIPENDALIGKWTNPKNKTSLPIKLRLIDGNDDDTACKRSSYYAQIEPKQTVDIGKSVKFSPGRTYKTLRFSGQETIELYGPDLGLPKINSDIKLDTSNDAVSAFFEQRREFLGSIGYPASDERFVEPKYWDRNFISVNFYTWAAGTGRNGISNEFRTWNVVTGEEINLWSWITKEQNTSKLPAGLHAYLLNGRKPSLECESYYSKDNFIIELKKSGLDIYEDPYGDECEEYFSISFKKLLPFLTDEGKTAVNAILSNKLP